MLVVSSFPDTSAGSYIDSPKQPAYSIWTCLSLKITTCVCTQVRLVATSHKVACWLWMSAGMPHQCIVISMKLCLVFRVLSFEYKGKTFFLSEPWNNFCSSISPAYLEHTTELFLSPPAMLFLSHSLFATLFLQLHISHCFADFQIDFCKLLPTCFQKIIFQLP